MFIIHFQYWKKNCYSWAVYWTFWCNFNAFLCSLHLWWMANINLIYLAGLWSYWLITCRIVLLGWMNWSPRCLCIWRRVWWDDSYIMWVVWNLSRMKCCKCCFLCCEEVSQQMTCRTLLGNQMVNELDLCKSGLCMQFMISCPVWPDVLVTNCCRTSYKKMTKSSVNVRSSWLTWPDVAGCRP